MRKKLVRNICMALCLMLLATAFIMPTDAAVCKHEYENTVCIYCGKIGGECGTELTWTFLPEEGLLRITGSGVMTNYSKDFPAPWKPYRAQIKEVLIGGGVTSFGEYAFAECTELVTINIPNAVSNIFTSSFEKCYSLETFELDKKPNYSLDEKGVLYNKKYTYLIALPGVFEGECYIPDTVINVGPTNDPGSPLRYIPGVTAVRVDENNTTFSSTEEGLLFNKEQTQLIIVPRAYKGDCTVPATVTSYTASAFTDCYGLTGIHVEEGNTGYASTPSGLLCVNGGNTVKLCPAGFTGVCEIPANISDYDPGGFSQCVGLTKFQVDPGNATYSGDEAGALYNKSGTKLLLRPNA